MDYSQLDEVEMPKRSDTIYEEIDNFADYELTQCVAYEMAVRNEIIIGLLHLAMDDIGEDFLLEEKDNVLKLYNHGITAECIIFFILNNYTQITFDYETNAIDTRYDANMLIDKNKIAGIDYADGALYKTSIKNENGKRIIDEISISDINDEYVPFISFSLKRPQIRLKKSKIFNLEVNLSLPSNELYKYIEKIKQDYDNNQAILKTPIEILGNEEFKKTIPTKNYPKKPNAEKYADMFFVYDYVKARLSYIQNEKEVLNTNLETEIEEIKKFHIGNERKRRIAYAKAEHLGNTIDTRITDIFNEEELTKTLNLTGANISKLYYAIKPYIDDLKYKELITGVSAS